MRFLTVLFFRCFSWRVETWSHQFLRDFYVNQTVCSLVVYAFSLAMARSWVSENGRSKCVLLGFWKRKHTSQTVRNDVEEKYGPNELGERNIYIFFRSAITHNRPPFWFVSLLVYWIEMDRKFKSYLTIIVLDRKCPRGRSRAKGASVNEELTLGFSISLAVSWKMRHGLVIREATSRERRHRIANS